MFSEDQTKADRQSNQIESKCLALAMRLKFFNINKISFIYESTSVCQTFYYWLEFSGLT